MTRAARRSRRARRADRRGAERRRAARHRLGEGGRRRVLDRFTWRKTAEGTAEHYYLELEAHARRRYDAGVGARVLTVDFDRLGLAARRAPARPRRRAAAATPSKRCAAARASPRSTTPPPTSRTSPRSRARCSPAAKSTDDAVGRRRERRRARPAVPRRHVRPRRSCPRCSSTSGTTSARSSRSCACCGPGGRVAATVPTRWPERVSWALNYRYHDTPGGHVRIYRQHELEQKLERAGLFLRGLAPRARVPLAVLVAEVRVRARQHRRRAGEALPRLPLPPDRAQPALGGAHRAGAEPGARQEPRRLRREGAADDGEMGKAQP